MYGSPTSAQVAAPDAVFFSHQRRLVQPAKDIEFFYIYFLHTYLSPNLFNTS